MCGFGFVLDTNHASVKSLVGFAALHGEKWAMQLMRPEVQKRVDETVAAADAAADAAAKVKLVAEKLAEVKLEAEKLAKAKLEAQKLAEARLETVAKLKAEMAKLEAEIAKLDSEEKRLMAKKEAKKEFLETANSEWNGFPSSSPSNGKEVRRLLSPSSLMRRMRGVKKVRFAEEATVREYVLSAQEKLGKLTVGRDVKTNETSNREAVRAERCD